MTPASGPDGVPASGPDGVPASGPDGVPASGPDGITAFDVGKSFDGVVPVLDSVHFEVEAGATLALLGPSGCGKTTLLRIIAGLEVPDTGSVQVGGRTVVGPGCFVAPEHRRVGLVFQDWALFPHLSVARNVGFGLPRDERRASRRIDAALELVGLADLAERMPATLSGGQQQRVALARAVAPRPGVLLLDEPFSNLDASLRTQVRTEIHALLGELGVTTVFVTHDQDEAFVLGDRVAVMTQGRVAQTGPPDEIYLRPVDRWVAGFVGTANLIPGVASGRSAGTVLGPIELDCTMHGPVDVLARPEHLDLVRRNGDAESGDGVVGLVEYVGHDTTYLVDCVGLSLQVRLPSVPRFTRGDRVVVRHRGGPASAFGVEQAGGAATS